MITYSTNTFLENSAIILSFVENGQVSHTAVYIIHPKHRNGTPSKSQWTITNEEEVKLFGWAFETESQSDDYYWGVIRVSNKCRILGKTSTNHESRIARFEHSNQPVIWHGYPVDYIHDPQHDCPRRELLLKWEAMGIIKKHHISRLTRGQGWNG